MMHFSMGRQAAAPFRLPAVLCTALLPLRRAFATSVTSIIEDTARNTAARRLVEQEAAVCDRALGLLAATRIRFKNEIAGYASVRSAGDISEPHGRYRYWTSTPQGQAQAVYYRCRLTAAPGASAAEAGTEIVLDLNRLSNESGRPVSLRSMAISPDADHSLLLAVIDTEGSDRPQLLIRSIGSGFARERVVDARRRRTKRAFDADSIADVGAAVWLPAKPGRPAAFLYSCVDATLRSFGVRRRALPYIWPASASTSDATSPDAAAAASVATDELVFLMPPGLDDAAQVSIICSKDGSFTSINVNSRDSTAAVLMYDDDFRSAGCRRAAEGAEHRLSVEGSEAAANGRAAAQTEMRRGGGRLILVRPPALPRSKHGGDERGDPAGESETGLQYFLACAQGRLIMVTNAGGAENYCILVASQADAMSAARPLSIPLTEALASARPRSAASAADAVPQPEPGASGASEGLPVWGVPVDALAWSTLVPHRKTAHIDDVEVCGGGRWLLVFESVDDLPRLLVIPVASAATAAAATSGAQSSELLPSGSFYVPLPPGAVEIAGGANADADSDVFRFSAVFATRPSCEFSIDLDAAAADVPAAPSDSAAGSAARRAGRLEAAATRDDTINAQIPIARAEHLRTVAQRITGTAPGRPLFTSDTLTSYRLQAPSWDGTAVPVTLTHRADLGIDAAAAQDLCRRLGEANERWRATTASPSVSRGPLSTWSSDTSGGSAASVVSEQRPACAGVSPVAVALSRACEGWDDWRFEAGAPILTFPATQDKAAAFPGTSRWRYPLLSSREGMERCGFHGPLPPRLSTADVKRIAQARGSGKDHTLPLARIGRFLDAAEAMARNSSASGCGSSSDGWDAALRAMDDANTKASTAFSAVHRGGGGLLGQLSGMLPLSLLSIGRAAPSQEDTHRRVLAAEEALALLTPLASHAAADRDRASRRKHRAASTVGEDLVPPEALVAYMQKLHASAENQSTRRRVAAAAAEEAAAEAGVAIAMAGTLPFACPRSTEPWCGAPTLLQLYGAYGHTLSTAYDPSLLPLLTRGWIAAFAHVRGGGEGGMRRWYEAGKGRLKHNGAHDAVAAVRTLVAAGLTRSRWLALRSESAGGVLGGYLANEWPHLAFAHVMRVPFVDVLGGLSDPSLPLAAAEYQEWGGNPAGHRREATEAAAFISAYDPLANAPGSGRSSAVEALHRAAAAALAPPHLMAVADTIDPRVPAASVAGYIRSWRTALAAAASAGASVSGGGALVLCKVTEHGHEGSADVFERFGDDADQLAFLYGAFGLKPVLEA